MRIKMLTVATLIVAAILARLMDAEIIPTVHAPQINLSLPNAELAGALGVIGCLAVLTCTVIATIKIGNHLRSS